MAKIHYLVRNHRDPDDPRGPRPVRAKYASLEEAEAQFDHDIEMGVPVVAIEDAKGNTVREP